MLWVFVPFILIILCAYIGSNRDMPKQANDLAYVFGVGSLMFVLVNRMYS